MGRSGRDRSGSATARRAGPPIALSAIPGGQAHPIVTGVGELDRVLGGGLLPSSVTLIAGEPGIGKSTLLLQLLAGVAADGRSALLVAAEESPAQVARRAARLGISGDAVWIVGDTDLEAIRAVAARLQPDLLVVDSIQTIRDPETASAPGSVAAVRACATALADDAKSEGGPAVVLVGHVTKDGSIAGPRALEHLVDTVLSFEGERHHALRLLRAVKHRFGPIGELGMWEMTAAGLEEVPDGAAFLLADRRPGAPGSVVFAGMDGRRPLLTEVQALVAPVPEGAPRRSASGYEAGRLAQLIAVLDQRAGVDLRQSDVYVSAVGGVRLADPGADLAVAAAIVSACTGRVVPDELVVIGEVGLGGELRQAPQMPCRLAEAARLGFRCALVPESAGSTPSASPAAGGVPIRLLGCRTVAEAIDVILGAAPVARPRLRVLEGVAAGPG